jgi:serine/threonine protein kinase
MSFFGSDDEGEEEISYSQSREEEAKHIYPIDSYLKRGRRKTVSDEVKIFERTLRRERREAERTYVTFTYRDDEHRVKRSCVKGLKIGSVLGSGSFGEVHEIENLGQANRRYVVKIVLIDEYDEYSPYYEEDFWREVSLQSEASSVGAAPRVIKSFVCPVEGDKFGFIVMSRYDQTLESFAADRQTSEKLLGMLLQKVDAIHRLGIVHEDVGGNNIMLKFDDRGDVEDLVLVDFGTAMKTRDDAYFETERRSIVEHWPDTFLEESFHVEL